jgi:hypothetical protein
VLQEKHNTTQLEAVTQSEEMVSARAIFLHTQNLFNKQNRIPPKIAHRMAALSSTVKKKRNKNLTST